MTELPQRIDAAWDAGASLVRVVEAVRCGDPWALARAVQAGGERVMAWSAPSAGPRPMVFIAAGIASELRPEGGDRFDEASRWWTQISKGIVELNGVTGEDIQSGTPVCLAGFAFSAGLDRSKAWKGWNDGAICIPEVLIIQDSLGMRAVFSLCDNQGMASLQRLRGLLQTWLEQVPEAQSAPTPANGAVQHTHPSNGAWPAWEARVEAARNSLLDGTMDKVVLARSEAYHTENDETFDPLGTALAPKNACPSLR